MKISTWTSRSLFAVLLAASFALPAYAFAAVKIINVMYNPPGADPGHEWIEISNTGTTSVSLIGYRLFEGGVNHKLTVAVGTSSLAAGAKAIITTDPSQYAADYPNFTGAIFKSSFTLSNTAASIALKDPSLNVVDTYSYTAPLIVKDPAPAVPKGSAKSFATSTNKKTYNQAAAANLSLPSLPAIPNKILYGLGLVTLLILGAGAALYAKPVAATSGLPEEFELE